MAGPKFSYLTGLTIQIFALIFIITKHNVVGGMLLFIMGDFEMLLAIRFSRLKENRYFTLFDLSISTVYYAIYILIYFFIVYNLPLSFLPREINVMILILNAYGCFRILFPLMNLDKGKIATYFFNGMLLCWVFPLIFLTDDAYLNIVSGAFFIQILYLLGGTLGFCVVSGLKQEKGKDVFEGCGICVILLIFLGGAFVSSVSILLFVLLNVGTYFFALILIWLLIVNYISLQSEEIKAHEDSFVPFLLVALFFIIIILLIASILPLLIILGVTTSPA